MDRLTSVAVTVCGETIVLRGDRTAYWPRERLLVLADLHAGKTESLRHAGVALPDGVLEHDLARLAGAVQATGAREVVILGDMVHDAVGLTDRLVHQVARWRRRLAAELHLVMGNHDRRATALPPEWDVVVHDPQLERPPFVFVHDVADDPAFVWHGHIHPNVVVEAGSDRVRLPCFHIGARAAVLPAFSTLTGGVNVRYSPQTTTVAIADGYVVSLDRETDVANVVKPMRAF